MNIRLTRTTIASALIALSAIIGGCANLSIPETAQTGAPGFLSLTTRSGSSVTFNENAWKLTLTGIEGRALVHPKESPSFTVDTTISYLQVAAVDSRGEDPWVQLLLLILGVLLVIGLVGIIIYAAFRATER